MTIQNYQQLIIEGIKGLPQEMLAEIADFVYFAQMDVATASLSGGTTECPA